MVAISKLINGGLVLASQAIYQDVAQPQQASSEQFNIIRFLGGSAPYVQHPGFGISTDFPESCEIEQVQLISRHGERFPTESKGKSFKSILKKFEEHKGTFKGVLAFLNDYDYFVKDDSQYGLETTNKNSQGTYAGTSNAMRHGTAFRARYNSLYNPNTTLPIFTTNSNRVHQTSEYFARGFMGDDFTNENVQFNIFAEDGSLGANSLTTRYACSAYNDTINDDLVAKFDDSFLNDIAKRITKDNDDINLKKSDVANLFEWCAYEINVSGSSPVCDLFTNEDFVHYSYYNDLNKYYSTGPGNNITSVIGSVLLNASLELLEDDKAENKIWLNFIHDTDIDHYLSALGIFTPKEPLPTDKIVFDRQFIHGNLVPQGARIYTEKLKCGDDSYVRYVINDSVIPIESCSSGPGFSCKFDDFKKFIQQRLDGINYVEQCGVAQNVSQSLTFYWDYTTKNYTAPIEI